MVGNELGRIWVGTIEKMECKPIALFRGLRLADLVPALARKRTFLSPERMHAPAGVIVMQHCYDFLAEFKLVNSHTPETRHR